MTILLVLFAASIGTCFGFCIASCLMAGKLADLEKAAVLSGKMESPP